MTKNTQNKTKTQTKKQLIEIEAARLNAHYPDLTKKDAEFICRTMADCIHLAALFIPPITDGFSSRPGESEKHFNNRKENSSIKNLIFDIVDSLGNFMCENKEFLAHTKEQAASMGKDTLSKCLFVDFVLGTFYGEYGIADAIEKVCSTKLKSNNCGEKTKTNSK